MGSLGWIIGLIVLAAATAAGYMRIRQGGQRKIEADARRIGEAARDYFKRSGAEVNAQCLPAAGRFLVLIESEPLKRFRYSHIVEAALIAHIDKTQGLQVERVFWRFPLPVGAASVQDTADLKPPSGSAGDEYVAQGVRQAKSNPGYEIAEDSWEQFEKARQVEPSDSENQER